MRKWNMSVKVNKKSLECKNMPKAITFLLLKHITVIIITLILLAHILLIIQAQTLKWKTIDAHTCKPGDIIFFRTINYKNIFLHALGNIIKYYNFTLFDHAGICVQIDDEMYLAEMTHGNEYQRHTNCIKPKVTKLLDRLQGFSMKNGFCALRQRKVPVSKRENEKLLKFIQTASIKQMSFSVNFYKEHVLLPNHINEENTSCKAFLFNALKSAKLPYDVIFPQSYRASEHYDPLVCIQSFKTIPPLLSTKAAIKYENPPPDGTNTSEFDK